MSCEAVRGKRAGEREEEEKMVTVNRTRVGGWNAGSKNERKGRETRKDTRGKRTGMWRR